MVGRNFDTATGSIWSRASCSAGTITVPAIAGFVVSDAGVVADGAGLDPAPPRTESASALELEQPPNANVVAQVAATHTRWLPRIGPSAGKRGKRSTGRPFEIGNRIVHRGECRGVLCLRIQQRPLRIDHLERGRAAERVARR